MRWQASTQRPWVLHCKRKRHFSEFSSEAARGDGGECRQQRQHHTESRQAADRQRRQRVSTESICVFLFLGRGAKTRCSCCRAAAEEPSTQKEASNSGQHAARQAHRRKGPEKALRSAVADAGETGGAGRGSGTAAPVRTNDAGRCAGQFPGRGPARPTYRLRCRTALQGRSRVSGARTGAGGGELSTTFLRHI